MNFCHKNNLTTFTKTIYRYKLSINEYNYFFGFYISSITLFGAIYFGLNFFISAALFFLIVFVFGRFFDHLYWENKSNSMNNESGLDHTDNKLSQFLYEQYLKGVYWNDKRKNR